MNKNKIYLVILMCILLIARSLNILGATTPITQQANIHYISTGNSDNGH